MKLIRLDLLAYGPFTDESLDLSAGDNGLHIIYGPNEAGKSSALRAIHGLLFGIPARTPDTFLHEGKALRIGAVLRNSEKRQLHFHRRKGNKDTLLNPKTHKGGAFPKDTLEPFLGGIDKDTFERVYGITHEELRRGGDEMNSLRGLIGESLFAATIGGSGLASLLKQLDEEAAAIYHPKKHSAELKKAKKLHTELQSDKRLLQLSKSAWEKLRSSVAKAEARKDEVVGREKELKKELGSLERIQRGLTLVARRREVRERLAELSDAVVLPEGYSVETKASMVAQLKIAREKIAQLQQPLEGESSLPSQINDITIPEGLLEFEDAINELKDRRAVTLKAESDTRLLQRDCETLQLDVERSLRDLGLSESFADTDQRRLTSEQRVLIQNLGNDEKRLREERSRLKKERAELNESLAESHRQLDHIGDAPDVTDLQNVVDRTRRAGDLQRELEEAQVTLASQQQQLASRQQTLGLWSGTLAELKCLAVPMTETIDRFAGQMSGSDQATRLATQQLAESNNELLETQKEIAALQTAGHVPTENELEQLRSDRDMQWQRIRMQSTAGRTPKDAAADSFEAAIQAADQVADRLRREAERVAHLAERTAQQTRLEDLLEQRSKQLKRLNAERESLSGEWVAQWSSAGIDSPLPPNEMRAWSRRLESLQNDARQAADQELSCRRLQSQYAAARDELRKHLKSHDISVPKDAGLDRLLAAAEDYLKSQQERREQRAGLTKDVTRIEKSLARLQRDEDQTAVAFDEWQTQWKSCMTLLGCDENARAEQANERMQGLADLFKSTGKIADQQKRIRDIGTDARQFEEDVRRLARRFLPDRFDAMAGDNGIAVSSADLALELSGQLEQARSSKARLRDLEDKLAATELELTDQRTVEQLLSRQLDTLCQLAGVATIDQLPQVERVSEEVIELRARLRDLEEQLHHQSGNLTLDEFTAQAEACDTDELPVRIETIQRELQQLEAERDAAVAELTELQRQMREADGSDAAAQKDEQSLGLLSRMHRDAAEYMRLKLASTMLRKRIEKHRAENEDPLLARASTLFSQMTCGEYSGLRTDYENDEPVIVGVRTGSDQTVAVPAMSDGTRDQLFLALRLGYVERQLIQHEPMPFIVDDILIHFDNDRSAATLSVLTELARQTQVIFLTHHKHLVELAEERLSGEACFVHHIDSRKGIPDRPAAAVAAESPE